MTENTEELQTQNTEEVETPHVQAPSTDDIADLKKRADASTQNYERLKKTEAEKKALQEELEILRAQLDSTSSYSDDDVNKRLANLESEIRQGNEQRQLESVKLQFPQLSDKWQEFDEYRVQFPIDKLASAAKLFLAENDMLEEKPRRKGLEKAGGGQRTTPSPSGMTAEDAKRLRESNFKEYTKLMKSGKLNIVG